MRELRDVNPYVWIRRLRVMRLGGSLVSVYERKYSNDQPVVKQVVGLEPADWMLCDARGARVDLVKAEV